MNIQVLECRHERLTSALPHNIPWNGHEFHYKLWLNYCIVTYLGEMVQIMRRLRRARNEDRQAMLKKQLLGKRYNMRWYLRERRKLVRAGQDRILRDGKWITVDQKRVG